MAVAAPAAAFALTCLRVREQVNMSMCEFYVQMCMVCAYLYAGATWLTCGTGHKHCFRCVAVGDGGDELKQRIMLQRFELPLFVKHHLII
jgi:hypothetical protein